MKRYLILILLMALGPGCANIIAANLAGEGLVDGMVARAGVVADKVMDGLDATEAVLERKTWGWRHQLLVPFTTHGIALGAADHSIDNYVDRL